MKTELKKALSKIDEVDFRELKLCIEVAEYAREICRKFGITKETLASKINIDNKSVNSFFNGCYPYGLKDMASLQAYEMELSIERMQEKVKGRIKIERKGSE